MAKLFLLPGHFDPRDTGAVAGGVEERTMTLHIAHICLETLLPLNLFEAILLPQEPSPLAERIKWVNRQATKDDFLLSLHFNAAENTEAKGIEAWIHGKQKKSKSYAKLLLKKISNKTHQKVRDIKTDDQNRLGRLGILHTKPLACLVELGFLTNEKEAELIKSVSFPNKVAKALVEAFQELLEEPKKITCNLKPPKIETTS